jgi:hypothetical protein
MAAMRKLKIIIIGGILDFEMEGTWQKMTREVAI